MSDAKRDEVRQLQDRIIIAAEKRGYSDDMRVSNDMPNTITLGALRSYIFPEYTSVLETVLYTLTSPNRR